MKKIQVLDGTWLKIIAVICMIFDHVGDAFFPNQVWMRIIGRLAFPIFAFGISESYIHTKNKYKYLVRLGIFAIISEIPFNLFVSGKIIYFEYQNVFFTFFLAVLSLLIYDKVTENKKIKSYILGLFLVLIISISALLIQTDYGMFGVLLVFIYYVFKEKGLLFRNIAGLIYQLLFRNVGIYIFGFLSSIPILFYNGKRGIGLKWFFYIFYPGHLFLLYILKVLLKVN